MAKNYIITADSVPDLDEWGWDDYWLINDWMLWHQKLKEKFGVNKANQTFVTWWLKQGTGANPLDARSFNTDFRNYAKSNGFFDALYGNLGLLKVIGAGTDVVSAGTNIVSNAAKGAENVTKVLKIVIPAAIFLALIGGTVYAYNKYVKN